MTTGPKLGTSLVKHLEVEWPMLLKSMANERMHWAVKARHVKSQRATTEFCLRANMVGLRLKPLTFRERLAVTLIRVAPRKLDDDNNVAAFKAIRDQVAAFFDISDNHPGIRFEYGQTKGPAAVRIIFNIEVTS